MLFLNPDNSNLKRLLQEGFGRMILDTNSLPRTDTGTLFIKIPASYLHRHWGNGTFSTDFIIERYAEIDCLYLLQKVAKKLKSCTQD